MNDLTVAVVSPGNMGSAIGKRLSEHGIKVITPGGRSEQSMKRASDAGMTIVEEASIGDADFVFSIVPPDRAVENARRLAPYLGSSRRPLYVDWNAIGLDNVREIEGIVVSNGGRFADGSIIGLPPHGSEPGPKLYASGSEARVLSTIMDCGIRFSIMDADIGAASALKLSYAGITKGLIALGSAMFLAAERAGCEDALLLELGASQPGLAASFKKSIPDMFSKAGRWVPELEEIATFVGETRSESGIYSAMARFYAALAEDSDNDIARLRAMTEGRQ